MAGHMGDGKVAVLVTVLCRQACAGWTRNWAVNTRPREKTIGRWCRLVVVLHLVLSRGMGVQLARAMIQRTTAQWASSALTDSGEAASAIATTGARACRASKGKHGQV